MSFGALELPDSDYKPFPGDENNSRYCQCHRRMGHGTGYCGTLLDIIQEKIANEELDYSPEGSKIEKDPLPNQNEKEKERPVAFSGMASDFDPQEQKKETCG